MHLAPRFGLKISGDDSLKIRVGLNRIKRSDVMLMTAEKGISCVARRI